MFRGLGPEAVVFALILLVPLIVFGVLVRFGGTGLSPQAGQTSP